MRPGDICVAIGDNPHYVDVTIAHSDLSSNARLARNSPAHPQVGADAYAKRPRKPTNSRNMARHFASFS